MVNEEFWRGRRVLVTGHTGFKGGWLSLWLDMLGAKLSGLALAPIADGIFTAGGLQKSMHSVLGDIRDFAVVQKVLGETSPEIVFHLAAQPIVRDSYAQPLETYATNVMGTAHVLEAIRHTPSVRAVVVVLGGADPYSNSKACAELVTAAYRTSFFNSGATDPKVAVSTARAGNVIGGGDWCKDRLVPDLVRSATHGRVPEIRNPSAIRPWQYVLEPLRGYMMLAKQLAGDHAPEFASAWNFGPDDADAKPVDWVVKKFLANWETGSDWASQPGNHPHEAHWLKLDSSKSASLLGWRPAIGLEEALRSTAEWYRRAHSGQDMRQFSIDQILNYSTRVREAHTLAST
ncbi:MAG: GDP-mannose 4,6-dehydratase [Proteobacteria bacterium]|nr:GDP-mannose 4,6-dehydratase [Pseudomonadota bacterium]